MSRKEDDCWFSVDCMRVLWKIIFFFFKQKTAYEMCGRDWSSDVCSSDLRLDRFLRNAADRRDRHHQPGPPAAPGHLGAPPGDRKSVV